MRFFAACRRSDIGRLRVLCHNDRRRQQQRRGKEDRLEMKQFGDHRADAGPRREEGDHKKITAAVFQRLAVMAFVIVVEMLGGAAQVPRAHSRGERAALDLSETLHLQRTDEGDEGVHRGVVSLRHEGRRGEHGELPPNDWQSFFGGPAWARVADGQWYLHLFDKAQPDVNWKNPDIHEEFKKTLRFWSDHGTDGFRIDVAYNEASDVLTFSPNGDYVRVKQQPETPAEK